jgi:hypothetical protein
MSARNNWIPAEPKLFLERNMRIIANQLLDLGLILLQEYLQVGYPR